MKELKRRIGRTFERHQKIFNAAMLPLSNEEKNAFVDAYYSLPGVSDYIAKKIEDYDEGNGESYEKFVDRNFFEYKAAFEKKQKQEECKSNSASGN